MLRESGPGPKCHKALLPLRKLTVNSTGPRPSRSPLLSTRMGTSGILGRQLFPLGRTERRRSVKRRKRQFDEGRIEYLVGSLHSTTTTTTRQWMEVRLEANHFVSHIERSRYTKLSRQDRLATVRMVEAGYIA